MPSLKNLCLTCLALLLLSACAMASSPAVDHRGRLLPPETLGPTAVRVLFFDQTVESRNVGGDISQTYYAPNGTLKQKRDGEVRLGSWSVRKDGRMCLAMSGEKRKCRFLVKEQNQYIKFTVEKSGKVKTLVTYLSFKPGNQLGL